MREFQKIRNITLDLQPATTPTKMSRSRHLTNPSIQCPISWELLMSQISKEIIFRLNTQNTTINLIRMGNS